MNIRQGNKQNLTELAEDLEELCARKDQPAPYDWERMRQLIEDNAIYLRTYIIPRTPEEEPGYKSTTRIAEFVPPSRVDLTVEAPESFEGTSFLAINGEKGKP